MALLAGQGDLQPVEALAVGDDAHVALFLLQDRSLLDMELEKRAQLAVTYRFGALEADPFQFVAEPQAVAVFAVIRPRLVMHSGKDAGGQHGRGVPGALLIGPVDDLDGMPGLDAEIVERAHDLEPRQNAQNAIVPPARRLGIEMAADHHRRQRFVLAVAVGEHRPHGVDGDRHPRLFAPFLEQAAALAVLVGQRLPVAPATHAGSDLRHFMDRIPEPLALDPEVVGLCRHDHSGPVSSWLGTYTPRPI